MRDPTFSIDLNDTEGSNILSALNTFNADLRKEIAFLDKPNSDTTVTLTAWIAQNEALIAKIEAGMATIADKLASA